MIGCAFLLSLVFSSGSALAWGPYAQQVIAHESGGPYRKPAIAGGSGAGLMAPPEDVHFIFQASMPKAWEYVKGEKYAKSSEEFVMIMEKAARGRGDDVQTQAWKSAQIAEIIGDNKFFNDYTKTCHERWFLELMVDAVLRSDPINADCPLRQIHVSCRPKLTAQTSIHYAKSFGGTPISDSDVMAMTYNQALAMLGERVLIRSQTFHRNALENSSPALWAPALTASALEVQKRLASNMGNPESITQPKENQMGRRGFELLKEIGEMVVWSGTGGLKTSTEFGNVRHEIILNDPQTAEKVVAGFLRDKVYRMKTEPKSRILCFDLLSLLTKELHGWTPTPLDCRLEELIAQ